MDCRAGLNVLEKRNISYPVWIEPHSSALSQYLYLLSYVPMIK